MEIRGFEEFVISIFWGWVCCDRYVDYIEGFWVCVN